MLTFKLAEEIAARAMHEGAQMGLAPLCVVVADCGGHLLVLKRHEKASIHRPQIAMGKASGCIGLGVGGRSLAKIAAERPAFAGSLGTLFPNGCVAAPGGVLIRSQAGELLGAMGISGDISAKDEACAVAAIEHAGLVADVGEE